MPLEKRVLQKSWRGTQKKRTTTLGDAVSSFVKALKGFAQSEIKVSLRSTTAWKCFPMVVPYCCDISEALITSAAHHGAGRQHLCTRCPNAYGNIVVGRDSLGGVVAETMETQKTKLKLQTEAVNLAGRGCSRTRWGRSGWEEIFAVKALTREVAVVSGKNVWSWWSFSEEFKLYSVCNKPLSGFDKSKNEED